MSNHTQTTRIPGKLMIAGEFAVLEPGQNCIVAAINRYIEVTMKPSEQYFLSAPQMGYDHVPFYLQDDQAVFQKDKPKLEFVRNALTVFNQFLTEKLINKRLFSLHIKSELNDPSGKKYGLGSSAAIVVAVISAMTNYYQDCTEWSAEIIFKLASIAHLATQGNGSCADVAASAYGGWLRYSAFNREWLDSQLKNGTKISTLVQQSWPQLAVERIHPPDSLQLHVGWTRIEASTGPILSELQRWKNENESTYQLFLRDSAEAVTRLLQTFDENDCSGAISALTYNHKVLRNLSTHSQTNIEIGKLKQLVEIAGRYGGGKLSGAGGGDCGIAFICDDALKEKLWNDWMDANITPLRLTVSNAGAMAGGTEKFHS